MVYNPTFYYLETWGIIWIVICRLLLHRPNSCESDIWPKQEKNENESDKKIVKQFTEEWRSNGTGILHSNAFLLLYYAPESKSRCKKMLKSDRISKLFFLDPFSSSFLSQKWCQISVRIFCVLSGTRNLQCHWYQTNHLAFLW